MDSLYFAALHRLPAMTHEFLRNCFQHINASPEEVWRNLVNVLRSRKVPSDLIEQARRGALRENLRQLEKLLLEKKIRVLVEKKDFPPMEQVQDPPYLLYVRGDPLLLEAPSIAVVGARRMTPYGEGVVTSFVPSIVRSGFATVSGMARGIDGAVHRQTLLHEGKTIGVLGTGIDRMYPASHKSLAESVLASGGALVSELPIGSPPKKWHFPLRNRLIARFAKAVIVVEAASGSGSLHTAQQAIDCGTPVYAVPGSINSPYSKGTNRLLGSPGVRPLVGMEDLQECWGAEAYLDRASVPEDGLKISRLLGALEDDPLSVDRLAQGHQLSVGECLAELSRLEIYGLAARLRGGWVRKRV